MINVTKRTTLLLVLAALVVATASLLLYAHARPAGASSSADAPVTPIALQRAPTAADALPAAIGSTLSSLDAQFGMNDAALAQARLVATEGSETAGNLYLVPGTNGRQCLADANVTNCVGITAGRPVQFVIYTPTVGTEGQPARFAGAVGPGVTGVSITQGAETVRAPIQTTGGFAVNLPADASATNASTITVQTTGGPLTLKLPAVNLG